MAFRWNIPKSWNLLIFRFLNSMGSYMNVLTLTDTWYTGTLNYGKCFASFLNFLRLFWNPKIFFGFHRLEDSKNRISWIREHLQNFEKIIFQFSMRKSSCKPSFRFFQRLIVFPQDFHEKYWKTWSTSIFVFL